MKKYSLFFTVIRTQDLNGATLQSSDNTSATYRKKNGEGAKGYVTNITETCDPENDLQLITTTNLEPNITDDQNLWQMIWITWSQE